jgi:23S rRNA pseudouridine2605 synthase
MAIERLQKILASAGVASRRHAETMITDGRVRVNGRVVTELGTRADPNVDKVEVDGRRLVAEDLVYLVVHKPRLVVSTLDDPEGRPTVKHLVRGVPARVHPVGRLDFHTSGVLLMTNDGDLTQGLLHPRREVPKTYIVKVTGEMQEKDVERWAKGVELDDGLTAPAKVRMVRHEAGKTWLEVTIHEGRNQQIRRMGDATGFPVMRLARLSFAGIDAEGLRPGAWRHLTREELIALRDAYGVPRKVVSPTLEILASSKGVARDHRGGFAGGKAPRPEPKVRQRAPRASRGETGMERPERRGTRTEVRTEGRSPRPDARGPRPEGRAERGPRTEGRGPRPEGRPERERAFRPDRAEARGSRPDARGPRPEGRSPRPEGRAPRPEGRSPRSDARGPRPEGRSPRPEGRSPRPEARGPRPEGRSPRPDARGPRIEGRSPRPDARGPRPEGRSPRPEGRSPRPEGRSPRPEGRSSRSEARGSRPEGRPPHPDTPVAGGRRHGRKR